MTVATFVFEPHIQKLIAQGIYKIVINSTTGDALPIVRDIATGQFKAFAKQIITQGANINPLFTPLNIGVNLITSGVEMYQTHRGFQKTYQMINMLQQSIGVLQGTMNLIGVGTVASVVLSAVNLQQTLKLRDDVKQLRLEVKDGFIDLKQALKGESREIIKRIEQVAQDVEYKQHKTILLQAYGRFLQAIECIKDALKMSDHTLRNTAFGNAQKMLYDALADYKNPLLNENNNLAGRLRRKECAWAIEQTLIMTYELQSAWEAVNSRLERLQQNIRQDAVEIISNCNSETELDFLFPEVHRINNHDLLALETWQNNLDYIASLSPVEKQELLNLQSSENTTTEKAIETEIVTEDVPLEITHYQELKAISHFAALKDNLKFIIQPESRIDYEQYITEQSKKCDHSNLVPSNWEEIPDLTVANLYWYLKNAA